MDERKSQTDKIKKQKKVILIVIASLILFVVLYFLLGLIDFNALFNKNADEYVQTKPPVLYFYNESYSKYPSDDEWYMNEAIKTIEYVYSLGPMTHTDEIITEDDAIGKGDAMHLIYKLIESIKAGDHESYNNCFSSYYYSTHNRQERFTKQKIYDIRVTVLDTQTKYANGALITEYNYLLEYRIRHNNGSLRNDINSDYLGKQQIKISERSGEGLLIDDLIQ